MANQTPAVVMDKYVVTPRASSQPPRTRPPNPRARIWYSRLTPASLQRHGLLQARYARGQDSQELSCIRDRIADDSIRVPGFAGNDSPSFVFPTAIATKGPAGGAGGSGSGRPAVANKPSFLTGGAGSGGHLSQKRGTEDLDFFIGDEAIAASSGPGSSLPLPGLSARRLPRT
jgi:hypothetical protein